MHNIQVGNILELQYPESISEMTIDQYLDFTKLVYKFKEQSMSYTDFSIELVYKLLGLKRTIDIEKHKDADKVIENIDKISELNESFFNTKNEDGKVYKSLKHDFVNNLVPKIKVGRKFYYGPSDALINTEFGEYVTALNAYVDYSKSGDVNDLNILVGTLYRPKKRWNSRKYILDSRIPFDKEMVPYYAKKLQNVSFEYKYAIYLFFSACQNFIVTAKHLPISGGVNVDLSILFKSDKGSGGKGIGMAGVIYTLAESNVFGDAEKTAKQNTYDVLLRMVQTYLQAKKMKENVKNR